jgi:DNA-directed RNA polymerase specialized sigma subunit
VLGVTESRACQIHGKAVTRLRVRMTAAGRLPA